MRLVVTQASISGSPLGPPAPSLKDSILPYSIVKSSAVVV